MDKPNAGGHSVHLPCYDKYVIHFHRKDVSKTHVIALMPVKYIEQGGHISKLIRGHGGRYFFNQTVYDRYTYLRYIACMELLITCMDLLTYSVDRIHFNEP